MVLILIKKVVVVVSSKKGVAEIRCFLAKTPHNMCPFTRKVLETDHFHTQHEVTPSGAKLKSVSHT